MILKREDKNLRVKSVVFSRCKDIGILTRMRQLEHYVPERLFLQITPTSSEKFTKSTWL